MVDLFCETIYHNSTKIYQKVKRSAKQALFFYTMIYLLPEETEYLLKLLEKQPAWWVKDSLTTKVEYDVQVKEERKKCNHIFHKYKGEKQCCSRCGGVSEGMGFSWIMEEEIDPKEYEIAKNKMPSQNLLSDSW